MKTIIISMVLLAMIGCASIINTAGTKEAFAACKTVDILTTAYAMHTGLAEANPIGKAIMSKIGMTGWIGLSVGLVWLVWTLEKEISKPVLAAVTVGTCAAGISNTAILAK